MVPPVLLFIGSYYHAGFSVYSFIVIRICQFSIFLVNIPVIPFFASKSRVSETKDFLLIISWRKRILNEVCWKYSSRNSVKQLKI